MRFTLRDTTISNGRAETYYDGGGIESRGTLIVENSTLSGNFAYSGGGINASGPTTITNSRIINNSASGDYGGSGGGIDATNLTLTDSVVANNVAFGGDDYGGYGGGEHRHVDRERFLTGGPHLAGGIDVHDAHARRIGEVDRAADQRHLGPGRRQRRGDGMALLAR